MRLAESLFPRGIKWIVARGVDEVNGVVVGVGVAVKGLRVGGVGDEGVGGGEAAQVGQVVAGVHVDEAQVVGRGLVVVAVAGVARTGESGVSQSSMRRDPRRFILDNCNAVNCPIGLKNLRCRRVYVSATPLAPIT